jgi:hypothetical protein
MVPPAGPLPEDWPSLVREPRPFAALYRLDCCGQRAMPTTVRGDGNVLALTVAVPPGGVAWEGWMRGGSGFTWQRSQRCRVELPPGLLPLGDGRALPLEPGWAAFLLSGLVPPGGRPLPDRPGWVEAESGSGWYRARIGGTPTAVQEVEVGALGEQEPALRAALSGRSRLPRRIELQAGEEWAVLELVEWAGGGCPGAAGMDVGATVSPRLGVSVGERDPVISVRCPAKVNLHLEVLGRRPDGNHELRTVFAAVGLFDELETRPAAAGVLELEVEPAGAAPMGDDNLVVRAARELAAAAGIRAGARIRLRKAIPAAAGLGGGSSDAAGALVALARLWGCAGSFGELRGIAARLGADVPFFLLGGVAWGSVVVRRSTPFRTCRPGGS